MTQEGIHEVSAADLATAEALFARHDIGALLGVEIVNPHTGQRTTVHDALASCAPFTAMVGTLDEALGAEFPAAVTDYVNSLRDPAAGEA
jgi:hypothetical protein